MRQEQFERLYAEHAGPLLGFLEYRTGSRPLAEDLLADTFERVLRSRAPFDPRRGSEKTWLYSIALNLLRDHARREATAARAYDRVAAGEREPASVAQLDAVEGRDALRGALERLSEEEREAIALRFGADLTLPEIARLTGQRLSTVEGRVYRALRKLKEELE